MDVVASQGPILRNLRFISAYFGVLAALTTIVLIVALDLRGSILSRVLLLLGLIASTGAIPFAIVVMGLRMKKWRLLGYTLFAYAWLVSSFCAAGRIEQAKYDRALTNGNMVARALERYYSEHGRFPENLGQLLPHQIAAVPTTEMGLFTTQAYSYKLQEDGSYALSFHRSGFAWATYDARTDTWDPGED
jgi:hypothetical protein